ncbi:Actin-related protein 10 [Grifola frondosa]|uniref:Actin-related protein 10 n=1 Tax=Grifola frondosa TaxID=5627 RepID=A0A1C7LJS3_GRIFR|nr:Actin-related protein 10 [Grifola frondosa]
MSTVPSTPRRQTDTTTPAATPQTTRVSTSHVVQSSPHYTTTRRHSLYGTEDRIILDPGSRIWKVGFSGEGKPRDVFYAGENGTPLWTLNRALKPADREEEDKILDAKLQTCLRSVFHNSLLTDPKSRKVILVEHPLLPLHIKDTIARILFNNLQVPSISFASSHLLSLLAAGRITGLVLDCGHLESAVLPIFSARPLNLSKRSSEHPAATRSTRVPEEVLTDSVIEEVKTRCCFVGDALDASDAHGGPPDGDDGSELDLPPATPRSPSPISRVYRRTLRAAFPRSMQRRPTSPSSRTRSCRDRSTTRTRARTTLQALATMYMRHSTATDLHVRVDPPPAQQTGTGRGTLIVPGWIRERAAEVLFEGGDVDESSVAEVILDCLLKVPVDLRKTLASTILVVGGTPMLPGFIPRLHAELVRAVSAPSSSASGSRPPSRPGRVRPVPYDRYSSLRPLLSYFAILNNPSPPPPTSVAASANSGKAPAFTPATMAWVGGSLAGALKTGGVEVQREKWDEADAAPDAEDDMDASQTSLRSPKSILPDWTRTPLPAGAPSAARPPPQTAIPPPTPQTAVGA